MTLSIDWCREIPIDREFTPVTMNPSLEESLNSIIEKYLPNDDTDLAVEYIGKINNIKGDPEIETRNDMSVSIVTIDNNDRKIDVKFTINRDKQDEAIQAFEQSFYVKVKGMIKRQSNHSQYLDDVTFSVLAEG